MKQGDIIVSLFDGGKVQRSLSFGATTLGLVLMMLTVSSGPVTSLDPKSSFGLLSELPATYFAALVCTLTGMVFAFTLKRDRYFYFGAVVMTLLVWNIVVFMEPLPRFWDSYRHFVVPFSMTNDTVPVLKVAGMFRKDFYLEWPVSYYLTAVALNTLGIDRPDGLLGFLQFFPLFASLCSLAFWIVLARRVFERYRARLMVALLFGLNVYFQFHYSPHAFALVVLPIFLLSLTYMRTKSSFMVFALVWVLLLATHLLTMLVCATVVMTMMIMDDPRVSRLFGFQHNEEASRPFKVTYLHGIIIIGSAVVYHILFAPSLFDLLRNRFISFDAGMPRVLSSVLQPVGAASFLEFKGLPYLGHPVSNIRLAVFLVCCLITFSIFLLWRKRWEQRMSLGLGFTIAAVGFTYLYFVSPNLNLSDRIPLYLLISTSMFVSMALLGGEGRDGGDGRDKVSRRATKRRGRKRDTTTSKKRWRFAILVVIIMLAGINSSSLYYQEAFNTITPESLAGLEYINSDSSGEDVKVLRTNLFSAEYIIYPENNLTLVGSFSGISGLKVYRIVRSHPDIVSEVDANPDMTGNILVALDPEIRAHSYLRGKERGYQWMMDILEDVRWHKIYDSGEFRVYVFMMI